MPRSFREKLRDEDSLLLLHLSEGVDDTARRTFPGAADRSRRVGDHARRWAASTAAACATRTIGTCRENSGSMVWSPFSNLLLYGGTSDVARARQEGVVMALGPDWSPTGSKNLLAELKVARMVSEDAGDVLHRSRARRHGDNQRGADAQVGGGARLDRGRQARGSPRDRRSAGRAVRSPHRRARDIGDAGRRQRRAASTAGPR